MRTFRPARASDVFATAERINPQSSPETISLLLSRRSLAAGKQCGPGPTEKELQVLLQCATRVPDHGKLNPWRIQVVRGEAQQQLGELMAQVFQADNLDATSQQIAFERQRPCRAPLLLIVSTRIVSVERIPRQEQVLSGGAVCQNILIAANALGYAANWLTGWAAYDETIKATLGIVSSDEILGFMFIGSATVSPKKRQRPALDEVVEYL